MVHTGDSLGMTKDTDTTRILVWYWGRRGGGAQFTLELAKWLARSEDLKVHLSVSRNSYLFDQYKELGLDTLAVKTYWSFSSAILSSLSLPFLRRAFAHYIIANKIDVVLSTMPHQWTFLMLDCLSNSGSLLVSILHEGEKKKGEILTIPDFETRRETRRAAFVVTLSESVRQTLIRRFGLSPQRSGVVSHPSFRYTERAGPARRFPSDRPFRLLFFGRIRRHKGLDLLINAYHLMRHQGLHSSLTVVGSGNLSPYHDLLNGIPDKQIVNRWVDDSEIAGFMREADLLVLPYRQASQSGVIPTAFRLGLPAVVTPEGGLVEQVDHMRTGVIAEETSTDALRRAITTLLENPALYERCSAEAISESETRLSWETISAQIIQIVRSVARSRGDSC
jgi:glycosyltransferase involved in cell wall biosynthesis